VDCLIVWKHIFDKRIIKLWNTAILGDVYCLMCDMFRTVCNPSSSTS